MLSFIAYCVTIATALGVLAGGLRGGQYLCRSMFRAARTLDSLARVVPVWYSIASEFQNNGGSSFKDRIHRIDHAVADLIAGQVRQRESLDSHSRTLDAQNRVLDQIDRRVEGLERNFVATSEHNPAEKAARTQG